MKSELIKIKESVEQFKNTKFNCLDAENKVVYVENTETSAIYGIAYVENENGVIFNTTKSEIIQEPKKEVNAFVEQANEFKKSIQNLFVFDDSKETFSEKLLYAEEVVKKIDLNTEYIVESVNEEDEAKIELSEFVKKFEQPILAYHEDMFDFLDSVELFDENNNIVIGTINSKSLNKVYVESFLQDAKNLYTEMDSFGTYMEHFEKFATKPESKEFVRKSALNLKKKGDIPKMCLLLKTEYNEAIDIAAATREITHYLENEAPNFAFNYSPSQADAPKFLNIMTGKFNSNDLMTLSDELNMAMSKMYTDLTPEKLSLLSQLQQRCDYMVQTQKISDHVMNDIITTFNKAFGNDQAAEVALPPVVTGVPTIAPQLAAPFAIEIEVPGEQNA